jgi:hypothetical protein
MNVSIGPSSTSPFAWNARSQQKDRERQEAIGEQRIAGIKGDLERLAFDVFIRHIKECQKHRFERRWLIQEIDVRVWLRHYFNPNGGEDRSGELETQIRVASRELGETYIVTFTRLHRAESSGWLLGRHLK